MATSSKISQAYGYAVCLIAVVTILINTAAIVGSLFDLASPLRSESYRRGGPSLTSFSAYKRERAQRTPMAPASRVGAPVGDTATAKLSDTELRQQFEDERLEQIGDVRFRAMRSLVMNLLLMFIAGGLFLMHWRWLRRENQSS